MFVLRFAWDNIIGRYGKKLAEFELNISVNMKFKEDMIMRLGGKTAPQDDQVSSYEKLGPHAIVERGSLFRSSLVDIVKGQHKEFCAQLQPPITIDDAKMKKFHKDFNVDQCVPIVEAEFPAKPEVETATSAAQVLEKSRALFEVNTKLSESLAQVAEKKKEAESTPSSPAPQKTVRKDLQGLPQKLIDKILAREAEAAAKEMMVDKVKEDLMRKLRRMPETARILKGVFVTERKGALLMKDVTKKVLASYKSSISHETLEKDIRYLMTITGPWLTFLKIQGDEYLKINNSLDINTIVADLQKKIEETK